MKDSWPSIDDIVSQVKVGSVTAIQNVQSALDKIEEADSYKAIIATVSERALERAAEIDLKVANNQPVGPLAGVPFIAKDNFLVFGAKTTAASNMLKNFEAPYQSTAIEKLEAAGAICVAKANLDAFAHGSSTENSDFFTTLNPHDKTRVPGGSSGGSAAAVVLGLAPFALGTDTGGSIRLPASYCGVVGLKPTYGLVSRSGVIAMASSTDVVGPIARTVKDAAVVLDVISGQDPLDSTSLQRDPKPYSGLQLDNKPTIGIVKEYFSKGLEGGVSDIVNSAIKKIEAAGYKTKEVSIPSLSLALACYYVLCPAEVSSNLSRYDGQRFGFSDPLAKDLDESYVLSRTKGFNKETKRRIMIGSYVLSSGYYDAYYKQAQTVRTLLINEFSKVFNDVDILIGPTASGTAFKIGERSDDPLAMYLTDIMTVAANLTGIPAISIPAGSSDGLPVGVQLMAPQKADRQLLAVSEKMERILE